MSDRHKELHEENEQLRRDLAAAQGVLAAVNAETMNTNTPRPIDPIDECVRLGRELARLNEDYNGMLEEAVAVEKERNALKAELAALREDKARLDWLEKNGPDVLVSCWKGEGAESNPWTIHRDFAEDIVAGEGDTLRAAIDQARNSTQ